MPDCAPSAASLSSCEAGTASSGALIPAGTLARAAGRAEAVGSEQIGSAPDLAPAAMAVAIEGIAEVVDSEPKPNEEWKGQERDLEVDPETGGAEGHLDVGYYY